MTITVKLFQSTDAGAPVMNGTAGAMIALLDACLINGFNTKAPSGITRSGSTATATFAAAHGFGPYDVVLHAGADQAEYNGEFRIFNITANSYDFTVTGTPATPATGTLSAKRAPLNWTKAFSGTNKAVYKSSEAGSTGLYLRIDDSDARFCRTRGYETMTDVDTGTGLFPTVAQLANGPTWTKSVTADATARKWTLVGDGRLFYLFVDYFGTAGLAPPLVFGDVISHKSGDLYHVILSGGTTDYTANGGNGFGKLDMATTTGCYMARSYNQLGSAVSFARFGSSGSNYLGYSGLVYPSPVDGGLLVAPVLAYETSAVRGRVPGIYHSIQSVPLLHGDVVSGVVGLDGKNLFMCGVAVDPGYTYVGRAALDITGPWR